AKTTCFSSNSPRRSATGASENSSLTSPLGRPRCATTAIRAPVSLSFLRVGSEARIRPSSVMTLPSKGTFRSARTKTRLPRRFPKSSIVFIKSPRGCFNTTTSADDYRFFESSSADVSKCLRQLTWNSELFTDADREVNQTAGVAPFVVVPGHNLHLVTDNASELRIKDG